MFKEKYNKIYKSADQEADRFNIFLKNLNIIDQLNENTTDGNTFFILSQYADLDPEEIKERYAIKLKPYYSVNDKEDAEIVGRQKQRELNTSELFNLNNATKLYEDFLKKYKKKKYNKKDRTIHFYRFVKTLVEINKKYFDANETLALDEEADVIKEPNEYFY